MIPLCLAILLIPVAVRDADIGADVFIPSAAHQTGAVFPRHISFRRHQAAVRSLQHHPYMIVLLSVKNTVVQDNVSGLRDKTLLSPAVVGNLAVAQRKLLPAAAARQTAADAGTGAVRKVKARQQTTVVNKGGAPESIRLLDTLLWKQADDGLQVRLPALYITMKRLQRGPVRFFCQVFSRSHLYLLSVPYLLHSFFMKIFVSTHK